MRACSVTNIETFILALLASLCSSNRPRTESCALSYFSRETGQQSASRLPLPVISLPRQILIITILLICAQQSLSEKNSTLHTENNFSFIEITKVEDSKIPL